jgi:hypothetical protein
MGKKLANRTAQYPLFAEFTFNYNDWTIDSTDGVKRAFGAAVTNSGATNAIDPVTGENIPGLVGGVAGTIVLDALPMPAGAVIEGGEVIVETAYATSTAATVSVGIAGSTTVLANAVDMKTAGRTALTMTTTVPMTCNAGTNIRLTVAYTVAAATAGKVRVRVMYTVDNRANEVCVN